LEGIRYVFVEIVDTGLWPEEESLRREILARGLNPDDYDYQLHLSGILDSDAPPEKFNFSLAKVLTRHTARKAQPTKTKPRHGDSP
jgi:hypothetical protein